MLAGDDVVRFTLEDENARDAEPVLRRAGARCLAVDPDQPDRVYAGTFDDGLYISDDGGGAWRRAGSGLADATEPSNLYRSEDAGHSWQRLPALRELPSVPGWSFPPRPWTHHVRTIALHPSDPGWLAVGIELGGVMRSSDGGATWADHNPQAHSDAHQLLTHPLASDRLYEAAGQGIARSDDLGDNWTKLEAGLDRHYAWAQAVDAADPDLWYVSVSRSPFAAHGDGDGEARLLRSRGNGWTPVDTWGEDASLRRMPYTLTALPGQTGSLLVGLRGGTLLRTDDAGESWSRLELELSDVIGLAVAPR